MFSSVALFPKNLSMCIYIRSVNTLWNKLDKIIFYIGALLTVSSVAIITILGIAQVLFRFIIKISVPWTEELMRALYIYMVFFGAVLLERDNGEVRTTMLIDLFSTRLHGLWEIIVSILSICFNIILIIGAAIAYNTTISYLGSLPQLSQKMFFVPILIGCPLMIIYQAFYMIKYIKELVTGERIGKGEI